MIGARARFTLVCGALCSSALASCQGGDSGQASRAPLPRPAPVVKITMREYRFDYDPDIPSGRVVFRLVNKGRVSHRPSLLPLPENVPPIDEQLRGSKRRGISAFAGVPDRRPGAIGTFAVDLVAGRRYALVCYARDRDGSVHALKGMNSEFRARARRAANEKQP